MLLCCVEAHAMGFQNTSFSTFRTASHTFFPHCASREEGQSDTHWGPASPSFLHIDPGGRCQWNSSVRFLPVFSWPLAQKLLNQ
uniref:Predicted gene 815 n=1 Tax=Mus musculus TaxID=10090 RepID=A0A494BAC9_MOUSE